MTPRQLKYFVTIARAGSITKAAQTLRIAQPALSQHIGSIEEEIGAPLFERHARGMKLTAEGRRLMDRADSILRQLGHLRDDVLFAGGEPRGPVRLSIAGALATTLIAPLFRTLEARFAEVRLLVSTGMSTEVRALLESRRVDLALLPNVFEIPGVQYRPVYEESFYLFGLTTMFGREAGPIRFREIGTRPLVAPDRDHDLRKLIERTAIMTACPLNVRYEMNNAELNLALVRDGLAFAIMPRSALGETGSAGLTGREIVDPAMTRIQSIAWMADQPLSAACEAVRDTTLEVLGVLVQHGRLPGRLVTQGL